MGTRFSIQIGIINYSLSSQMAAKGVVAKKPAMAIKTIGKTSKVVTKAKRVSSMPGLKGTENAQGKSRVSLVQAKPRVSLVQAKPRVSMQGSQGTQNAKAKSLADKEK